MSHAIQAERTVPPALPRPAPTPAPPPTPGAELRHALLESRQRWRQFGALATDLAFETDTEGRLTFVAPETALGHAAESLLGQPGQTLLADTATPDPFRFTTPARRRHTWFRNAAGQPVCMALTVVPMTDEAGTHRGTRGIAVNVTDQERAEAATASALRRGDVLDHILTQMRQEVLAPRMMRAVLDAVMRALGSPGAAVVDLLGQTPTPILHQTGAPPPPQLHAMLPTLAPAFTREDDGIRVSHLPDGTSLLACPCSTRFGDRAALLAWRPPAARPWDSDDIILAGSVSGVVRIVLEHEAIQRELARQARTDPLTGLLNRRAFLEEATRRLDRLEQDGLPGTLLFMDLDRLKQLNDGSGHEAGDAALLLVSSLLQRTFRPTDLVARLGGDEFAAWLDGADSLTAAERAEDLRLTITGELAHLVTTPNHPGLSLSTGIATREPGSDETLDQVIGRADQAMYDVKRQGGGQWRVSHLVPPL